MLGYLARRLGLSLVMLLGVVLATFLLHHALPGDPAAAILGKEYTPEKAFELREVHGLNDPLLVQFGRYLRGLTQGDLGLSHMTNQPVTEELKRVLPATLELSFCAIVLATFLGIAIGVLTALRPRSWWDFAGLTTALAGVSLPIFWLGFLAIEAVGTGGLASEWIGLELPSRGRFDAGHYKLDAFLADTPSTTGFLLYDTLIVAGDGTVFLHVVSHLLLPALVLASVPLAVIARITRASVGEVLLEDYIRTARAKGLAPRVIVIKHALRNAAIPIVTSIGTLTGYLVGGAVLTETIFSWPGTGTYAVDAIVNLDVKPLQAAVLVVAVGFVFINLAVDLSYAWLDPRVRAEGSA